MALPEDDVEEVDPEPALARDPRPRARRDRRSARGSGRALATAELVRALLPGAGRAARRRRSCSTPRRSARSRSIGRLVDGRPAAVRPDAARRRVRAAPDRQRPRARGATATSSSDDAARAAAPARGRDVGPGRRAQGRQHGHRRAGRVGGDRAVREPGPRVRRHRRRARGHDRLAAGAGPGAVRRGPARRLPPRARPARRSASGSGTRACWRPTCPTRSRWPAAARGGSPNGRRRAAARVRGTGRGAGTGRDAPRRGRSRPRSGGG